MRIHPNTYSLIALLAVSIPLPAQQAAMFASGLQHPSKVILTPGGKLMVTECGKTPNSGRISLIDSTGTRSTLIDGLPSGLAAPGNDPDGENGLALSKRTLYIAIGEGDSHVNGAASGQILPNPAGPSSPIFSSIISVTFSGDIDRLGNGFSISLADQFTLADGLPVRAINGAGDNATFQLISTFRDLPDAHSIYRNSHPYGLAMLPSKPGLIYMADAGMNTVSQIELSGGRAKLVTRFPNTPSPVLSGPPTSEAVPNSIQPYGIHFLVSLLSGVPFAPGASRIVELDPSTGKFTNIIPGQTSAIDVQYQKFADGSTQFYVLEYSLTLAAELTGGAPGPGQLVAYSTKGTSTILARNLNSPSSMVLDPASGKLYITDLNDGTILTVSTR